MPRDRTSVEVLRLLKNAGSQPTIIGPLVVVKLPARDWYRYLLLCPGGGRPPEGRSLTPAPGARVYPLTPEAIAAHGQLTTREAIRPLLRKIVESYRESA